MRTSILLGAVVAAYFFLAAGLFLAMIGLMLVLGILFGILTAFDEAFVILLIPVIVLLIFAVTGFYYGYYQRLKVRVWQWLSGAEES